MKLFENLYNEICQETEGVYAPYYYRYLGYSKDMSAAPSTFRANGIYSLFTETKPVILKSELIVGNKKALFSTADQFVLNFSQKTVENFGGRYFSTNKDHYAPNYEHILSVGLPGLLKEVDVSLKNHKNNSKKMRNIGRYEAYPFRLPKND